MTEDQFNERERRWDVVRTVMMSSPEFKLENEKKTIEQIDALINKAL